MMEQEERRGERRVKSRGDERRKEGVRTENRRRGGEMRGEEGRGGKMRRGGEGREEKTRRAKKED